MMFIIEQIENIGVDIMQLEEYKFIYEDLKQQIKQIPHLQSLLRLTQKSTRKLQCLNMYSTSDKREFDLQLQQQQITKQIKSLYSKIQPLLSHPLSLQPLEKELSLEQINSAISQIKEKNIQIFDLLNRQDQLLSIEIEGVWYGIEDVGEGILIKEEDQFEEENMKESNNNPNGEDGGRRVDQLKKEIDEIGGKIMRINGGKGKWYQNDHLDFIKIYNRCAGNGKRIIEEGVKILGMNNTEVMDHLELYENYLQLEKQKKIISEQYKQIKLFEKVEEEEKKQRQKKQADDKRKLKKQKQSQQIEKKKQAIQKYKQKKEQQKQKMILQQQKKQKQKIPKIPIPPQKRKQILQRNQKYIAQKQTNFKKSQEPGAQKKSQKTSSVHKMQKSRDKLGSRSKLPSSSQNKPPSSSQNNLKKPSQAESEKNI